MNSNEEILEQLRCQEARITEIMTLQTDPLARALCSAERLYVNAVIEFRMLRGGLRGIILPAGAHRGSGHHGGRVPGKR